MKLTQNIIRTLIQEELHKGILSEQTLREEEQNAVTQISGLLIRLDADGMDAQEVLNQAEEEFRRNVLSHSKMVITIDPGVQASPPV